MSKISRSVSSRAPVLPRKMTRTHAIPRRVISTFFCLILCISLCETKTGTTKHFKDIVMGKCWNYVRQYEATVAPSARNCTTVWRSFSSVFLHKDPCKVKATDYESYFDLVQSPDGLSKVLFWSGTKKAVHEYSDFNLRYTTLEDTFSGYIVDDLNWCGSTSSPDGLDYQSCPECGYNTAYWAKASQRFAKSAKGTVYVMLNGSLRDDQGNKRPAYRRDSFFGSEELPNLDPKKVDKLNIIVIHTPNESKLSTEYCGQGSLSLLMEDSKKQGIKAVQCHNDPPSALHVLCIDYPEASECRFLSNELETAEAYKTLMIHYRRATIILGCFLGIAGMTFVCIFVKKCYDNRMTKERTESVCDIIVPT